MADETIEDEKSEDEEDVESDVDEEEEESDEKEADEEDDEPPTRNTVNAQRRIIEKQKKELSKKSSETLTPAAEKLIADEVAKRVAPLQDELNFRDYFSSHPEDKKFEKAAKKRFEAWPNTPIEEIMKTLRPGISAEERKAAEEKAKKGSMKGGTNRETEEEPGQPKTQKENEAIYKKVKRGDTKGALKDLGIQ